MKRYATYHQGTFEYKHNEKNTEICCKSSKIFLKIAKYLESYEEMDHEESIGDISTEPLWKALFAEIRLLFNEIQYNVVIRRSTLQAIQKIIDALPDSQNIILWEYIMNNILLGMFDRSVGKYIEQLVGFSTSKAREVKRKEISQPLQTPTFSFGGASISEQPQSKKATKKGQGKRMKFDEESIKKFHQRSNDDSPSENVGFGMAPEETPKTHKPSQTSIDDQSICLQVMKIFNENLKNFNDAYTKSHPSNIKTVLNLWIMYSKQMSPLINNASAELLKGVLETLNYMLGTSLGDYIFKKYDSVTLGLFEEINSVIQRKTDLVLTHDISCLFVKIFRKIFTKEN